MIHVLFIENDIVYDYFTYLIQEKYSDQHWNTAAHVPVLAIHKAVYDRFLPPHRLRRDIRACQIYPEYKAAWDIVLAEGEENIIHELRAFVSQASVRRA